MTSASLSWWVSLVGFPANASFPVEELDPTVGIWTNASLKLEGHGNLLETRAAPGSMGLFLSLVTMSGYTLVLALLLLSSDDVSSQEALLLWVQAVSWDVTLLPPQWFPTGGNTTVGFLSGHDMAQWMFMWDKKVFKPFWIVQEQVVPVLGAVVETMALMG